MAASIDQVTEFLAAEGLAFVVDNGLVRTVLQARNYRDGGGSTGIPIVIMAEDEGRQLRVVAPNLYAYRDGPHKTPLFTSLLLLNWNMGVVRYHYDMRVGEVGAAVEVPLDDMPLTRGQLMRCVYALAEAVDANHEAVVAATSRGALPRPKGVDADVWVAFQSIRSLPRQAGGGHGWHGLPE